MAYIRALTIFLNPKNWEPNNLKEYLDDKLAKYVETLDNVRNEMSIKIWTLRLAMPYTSTKVNLEKIAMIIEGISEKYNIDFASAFHFKGRNFQLRNIKELLETYEKIFASVKVKTYTEALFISEIFQVLEGFPSIKFAIHLGPEMLTPYFPLAKNIYSKEGLAIAPFIIEELKKGLKEDNIIETLGRNLKLMEEFGLKLSRQANLKYYGIDISPSPFLEQSIVEIVETLSGVFFGEYGTHWGLQRLMSIVFNSAKKYNILTTGFKEIMLPVVEDDLLKVRAIERKYGVKDLLSYVSVCAAGLDMIPLAKPLNKKQIVGIILDLMALSQTKNKPLGLRLIPLNAKPGEIVEMKMFGKIPVMEL